MEKQIVRDWTDEQKDAINHKGKAAIVSAAAGSGKTAVLIERVMKLILDEENPVKADEIVITTFTQKAAAELKARLSAALYKALSEKPDSAFLKEQSLRLNDASISTISSFCLGIIRKYSAALEISPDFSILDESEGTLILSKALDAVMEKFCEDGDEEKKAERERLYDWYGGEDDGEIAKIVEKLYSFSRNLISPKEYFKKWLNYYENPEEYSKDISGKYFDTYIHEEINELQDIADNINSEVEFEENEKLKDFGKEMLTLADIFSDATIENIGEKLAAAGEKKLPVTPRGPKDYDNSYIKELRGDFSKLWEDITEKCYLLSRCEKDLKVCCPVLKTLISLTEALEKEYAERKAAVNKYDFSDIEALTLKLLRDEKGEPTPTAREIAANTAEIIVDEFQDSNDIQYEIFKLISKDTKNLYFVGDIKQSIYRFRGANPLVFSRLTKKGSGFEVINLNKNFRSNHKVIDAVNCIFTGQMTEELGDVNYNDSCKLVPRDEYCKGDESKKAEFVVICGEKSEDTREKEAAYIADRILEMIETGFKITDSEGERPCRFGDFAVLMGRYSANIHIYKKIFDRYGIPYEAKEESGFTDFSEVKCALSILRIIDNPYRDKELTEVMMRPPYLFTADEMARIKLSGGTSHPFLFSGLCLEANTDEKCNSFLAELRELREYAGENTVENLVRRIYEESNFSNAIISSPDGRKRDENLKLLIHYASVFSEGGGSLRDFIGFMDNIKKKEVKLTRPQDSRFSQHRIKIMTVHGSKGLEFPVCFVANLSNSFKNRENSNICLDPYKGIGMRVSDSENMLQSDTFSYSFVSGENERLERSEEMRLLYVAATRAKEKLIFTAPRPRSVKSEDMHFKWVSNSAENSSIFEKKVIGNYLPKESKGDISDNEEKTVIKPFAEYAYKPFTLIPSKVTATQIGVKSVDDFAVTGEKITRYLRKPSFLKEDKMEEISGKKKGDAYHKAMELLDFSGSVSQLDSLLNEGKLTEEERYAINDKEIKGFLDSSLCKRAAESGKIRREFPIFCEYRPEVWGDFGVKGWENGEERPFVQGIADMYFEENGEIVLVDYKTNKNTTPDKLINEYKGQLSVYKTALEEAMGMRVKECYLYSFTLGKAIAVSV